MPGYNVGEAFIQISPNFDGFANQLTSRMRVAGDQGARDFARSFNDQLRRATNNANIGPNASRLVQQGAASGAKFSESFKATVESALRSLPDITVDANTAPAQREIAELKTRLETLSGQEIGVDITSGDAVKELERIRTELRRVSSESADIDVKVDTARAVAQLDELRAEIRRVNGDKAEVQVSTAGARREVSALTVAIAALIPAAAVAGVAVGGAFIGVAPAAGTAALAVLGIKDAYQTGALNGTSFARSVIQGNDALTELKGTAAAGVLPGLDQGLQGLLGQLSPVNDLVHQFSVQLGGIAGTTGPALASILTQLQPLFTTVGNLLQIGANKLATFAQSGTGVKQFSDFVLANLPNVLDTLGEVAGAFVKIVQAVAPVGQVVITVIGGLADGISALPISVLTGLTTAILATVVAMKALAIATSIQAGLTRLQGALAGLGRIFGIVALQSISLRTTLLVSLGVFGLIAAAIGIFAAATSDSTDNSQAAKDAMDSYAESVKKSTDALNAVNVANTKKQLSDKGALATLDSLHTANQALAVTYDDLSKAANGSNSDFQKVAARLGAVTGPQKIAAQALLAQLAELRGGLYNAKAEQDRYNQSLSGQLTDLDSVARATGLTADQTKQYAAMLGLTVTESGAVKGSQSQVTDAIRQVSAAFGTATQTGSEFLDALNTFSTSGGSAADRATVIGEALKAANGDALNFASQINAAAVAGDTFAKSIKSAADGIGKNGISTKAFLKSIIDLKTGTIDYKNAAAGPLIAGMQGIQNAAVNAAKATYQNSRATKDGKSAAADAYKVYVSQTKGQLTDQLQKLGLNEGAAKRLAKQYLNTPSRVKTLIEQEGANPVVTVLKQIRDLLGEFTGHPYRARLDVYGNALPNIQLLRENLAKLPKSVGVSINSQGQTAVKGGGRYAKGGTIPPNTRFTVGEEGWEGGESDSRGRVTIYSHPQSKAMGFPAPVRGYASGTGGLKGNALYIANTLRSALGLGRDQIAGVLGNLKIESGFNPRAVNGDGSNSTGIAQWLGPRLTALKKFSDKMNLSFLSIKAQSLFLAKELKKSGTAKAIAGMKGAGSIAAYVDRTFERSDGSARGARVAAARTYADKLKRTSLGGSGKGGSDPVEHALGTSMKQLFTGSKFTSGLITAVRNGVHTGVTVSFRHVAAPTMRQFLTSATKTVSDTMAAAVAIADTSPKGLARTLTARQGTAVTRTQSASVAQALSKTADANAAVLKRNADRLAKQLTDARRASTKDAGKLRDQAADLRAKATKLSRDKGSKAEIKRLRDQADALTKEARLASSSSKDRVAALQKEADVAKRAADKGKAAADKARDGWKNAADAAKQAQQAAADAAKALVDGLQKQADDLAQLVTDFKKTVTDGLTSGTDLATMLGKASVTAAAGSSTSARKAAEVQYTNAQANLRAIQARIAGAGGTPADYAALARAQQAQTEAVTALTAAQQAETQASAALAEQQKTNPIVSAAQLKAQFDATLAQTQTFASDLQKLTAAGAGQDIITQVLGLGADAGDQLAKSLLAAGPAGITALQSSMKQISDVAAASSDALAGVFYTKGQNTLLQLVKGMTSQFPALKAALQPIVNEINAALNAERSATTKVKALPTKTTPSFASGVLNFRGPAALVHGGELLINNQTPGLDVLTAKQTRGLVNQVSAPAAARAVTPAGGVAKFEGDLYLDSGEFLGRVRGEANNVVDARVASAQARAGRRVQGGPLDHLARR